MFEVYLSLCDKKIETKTQGQILFLQTVENANFDKSQRHTSCVLQVQMSKLDLSLSEIVMHMGYPILQAVKSSNNV
jgi:hypothetical protein